MRPAIIIDLDSFFNVNEINLEEMPLSLDYIFKDYSFYKNRHNWTLIFITEKTLEPFVRDWINGNITKYTPYYIILLDFNYEKFIKEPFWQYDVRQLWVERLKSWINPKFDKELYQYGFEVRPLISSISYEPIPNNEYTKFYEDMIGFINGN